MQTKIIASIFLFAAFGATQVVELDDVPRACQQACQDIAKRSDDCDRANDNDASKRDCVCNADNSERQADSCATCVKGNIQNDDDADDDLTNLFSTCGWNYADISPTSSSDMPSSTQSNGGTSSTSGVMTTTQTFPATVTTETSSGVITTETIPATTVTSTGPASPTPTDNAGSGLTIGFGLIAMAALPVVL